MVRRLTHRAMVLLLGLAVSAGVQASTDNAVWQAAGERDDIRVYSRSVEGSGYIEVKAETLIKADINQLMGVMDDTQACPRWMHNCLAPKLLAKPSLLERYTYLRNDLPWPFADRELIVHSKIDRDEHSGAVTIRLTGIDEQALPPSALQQLPGSGKSVRAKSFNGQWQFIPEGDAHRVIYRMHIDLGGSPAPSLANARVTETPLYTLANMRAIVGEEKYRQFKAF